MEECLFIKTCLASFVRMFPVAWDKAGWQTYPLRVLSSCLIGHPATACLVSSWRHCPTYTPTTTRSPRAVQPCTSTACSAESVPVPPVKWQCWWKHISVWPPPTLLGMSQLVSVTSVTNAGAEGGFTQILLEDGQAIPVQIVDPASIGKYMAPHK